MPVKIPLKVQSTVIRSSITFLRADNDRYAELDFNQSLMTHGHRTIGSVQNPVKATLLQTSDAHGKKIPGCSRRDSASWEK